MLKIQLHTFYFTLSILAFIFIALSANVIKHRLKEQALLGSKRIMTLKAAIRAQANFAEYIPITMLLFWGLIYYRINYVLFIILCVLLVLSRVSHIVSLLKYERRSPPDIRFRKLGIITNFLLIIFSAIYIIFNIIFY